MSTPKRDDAPSQSTGDDERPGESPDPTARKEKMLHARIPESLDRAIKSRAGSLGMSVSTVVRHVLLNTFNLVEGVVTDGTNLALTIAGEKPDPGVSGNSQDDARSSSQDPIVGWQQAILELNAVCDRCNAILARGTRAAIAIRGRPGPSTIICETCLPKPPNGDSEAP